MPTYDKYFLMKSADAPAYVQSRVHYFEDGRKLTCEEIGDGNINYVFRVADEEAGRSIIVKQAGQVTRIDKNWELSVDRGRIEAEILRTQGDLAPGLVPKVYLYDEVMCAIIMEDMTNHSMMRSALLQHRVFPKFADQISTFLVNTLLLTSDVVMGHKEKKERVKSFINPELCEITEQLVYTEPYNDCRHRNNVLELNREFVEKNLYSNDTLKLAVAKQKFDFMNNAQCLIHGDLHTGSIFINEEHTFVFDPEFAFYGPAGYDIGNMIANLFFALGNGIAVMEKGEEKDLFVSWISGCIRDIVDLLIEKYHRAFARHVSDLMAKSSGFEDWYLGEILRSTAGVTGLEMNRRIVGMANVKDITSIQNLEKRAEIERVIITAANEFILHASEFVSGDCYLANWNKAMEKIRLEGRCNHGL